MSEILKAHYNSTLKLGRFNIKCAVLKDGRRVLVERSVASALGRKGASDHWQKKREGEIVLPEYISAKYLQPYISDELKSAFLNPIFYLNAKTGTQSYGLEAHYLSDICNIWIQAQKDGVLNDKQEQVAEKAYILLSAFAKVGIVALVDEATGYQEVRDKDALQKILDAYLSKELSAWAKRFPDEFYKEIFRLKGWVWNPASVKRPSCVANYTTNIIYDRLAPNILEELEKRNPKDDSGRRKHKHHQFLTDDIGHPALSQLMYGVLGLMRTQQTWEQFMRLINRAYPIKTIGELFSDIE